MKKKLPLRSPSYFIKDYRILHLIGKQCVLGRGTYGRDDIYSDEASYSKKVR
ncbi:hypothetical protein BACSP_02167 [Bacillus sp. T2.9-1]|nr:hypothetical protein BACSP_02167 [Bacillus sp. T2.9-1]